MRKKQRINENENPNTYQTGVTKPEKSYSGAVAVLLMLVIFLCGITTALGLMNIKLFSTAQTDEGVQAVPMNFVERSVDSAQTEHKGAVTFGELGFAGREVRGVYRSYYNLPEGIYITQVSEGSPAFRAGIVPGDVLVGFGGKEVPTVEGLQKLLLGHTGEKTAKISVFRQNKKRSFEASLNWGK